MLGTASLLLYLLIGIAGAPVYAEHKHGWEVFSGATGGYIVGFVVAAALTGYLAERGWDRRFSICGLGDAHRQRRHLRVRPAVAAPLARA